MDFLFQEWSKMHFNDKTRENIVKFASDQYEHAKLIVSEIIKKIEIKYVSQIAKIENLLMHQWLTYIFTF